MITVREPNAIVLESGAPAFPEMIRYRQLAVSTVWSVQNITLHRILRDVFVCLALLAALVLLFPTRLADLSLHSRPTRSPDAMSTAALKHLKVAPKEAHKATVIFLHVSPEQLVAL